MADSTRRAFVLAAPLAATALGQVTGTGTVTGALSRTEPTPSDGMHREPNEWGSPYGDTTAEGDTFVILFDGNTPDEFGVGVRTSVKADYAMVEVFYNQPSAAYGNLLLSKESMAPIAGTDAYGGTRRNFTIPRDAIDSIVVTFFNRLNSRVLTEKRGVDPARHRR
jgi:hypothetical protein